MTIFKNFKNLSNRFMTIFSNLSNQGVTSHSEIKALRNFRLKYTIGGNMLGTGSSFRVG